MDDDAVRAQLDERPVRHKVLCVNLTESQRGACLRELAAAMGESAVLIGERQDSDYVLGVTRNPGYQNVYLAGSCRLSRHVSPFVRAENLLNSRYQEALGYAALSRSITGGIRLEW